jgi:guanylate kinase
MEDRSRIIMIVLVGESASGKSSIEKFLVEKCGYNKIITYTTRPPRQNEVDGIDYHFISIDKFNELKDQGFFAETACYRDWLYGSAKEDYTDNKIAVLTPHGLRQISKLDNIDITSFYINVPRRDRLIKILQRGDNIEEAYRRNLSDVGQFDGLEDEVDYVINNDGYKKSIEEMTKEVLDKIANN